MDGGGWPTNGIFFFKILALPYSFIGIQTIYLAINLNPIYWNTVCLIVNSASLENDEEDDYNKNNKDKSTDYSKLAKAIEDITSRGIKVSLIDINKSGFSFEPDELNNEILFGLKGDNKISGPIIDKIIMGRSYSGIIYFMSRCPLNKTQMISLIKYGAFDKIDNEWASKIYPNNPSYVIMAYYISLISETKTKWTLQIFNGLVYKNIVPNSLIYEQRTFEFNKYLKKNKNNEYYCISTDDWDFYEDLYDNEVLEIIQGIPCIKQKN